MCGGLAAGAGACTALHRRWNLNVMPTLPGSLLRHLEEASELQSNEFLIWLAGHTCTTLQRAAACAAACAPRTRRRLRAGCEQCDADDALARWPSGTPPPAVAQN
eukprot:COSAG01_NODE_6810_length_3487_cov_3.017414_6_plen_105_part_00